MNWISKNYSNLTNLSYYYSENCLMNLNYWSCFGYLNLKTNSKNLNCFCYLN